MKQKGLYHINVILILYMKWLSATTFQPMVPVESIIKATLESLK